MIDIAEILQQIQDAVDEAGATVEVKDNDIVVTFPNGTVQVFEGVAHLMGSGATSYNDDMGDVIDLLDPQGVIPPVEMSFSVPELENVVVEEVEEASTPAAPSVPVDEPSDPDPEPEDEPEGDPEGDPGPGPNPDPEPEPEPEPEPDTPPSADPVTTPAETSGEIPSGLALLLLSEEIPFAFKQFNVNDEIGDNDNFQGPVDMGGADAETALGNLVFTYNGDINYGTLVLESGGVFTVMTAGTTYTSADTIWWLATLTDISEFEVVPNATFTYSVTDADGNVVGAPVVITVDGDLPNGPPDPDAVNLSILTNDSQGVFQMPLELFDFVNGFEIENLVGFGGEVNGSFATVTNPAFGIGIQGENNVNWNGSLFYHGSNLDDPGIVEITALDLGQGETLNGDGVHTVLVGSEAHDTIQGSDIAEIIMGGQDNAADDIFGGGGDDVIFMFDKDQVSGEGGEDTFLATEAVKLVDILDFSAGDDEIDLSSLGVDDEDISVVDHDDGTASVMISTDLNITVHYDVGDIGDITFHVDDGIITADVS